MMGIYKFQNKENGKVYIGQSTRLEARYQGHKANHINSNLKDYNTKFYRALRKYGFDNFDYKILEQSTFFSKQELNEKEQYWISYYNSYKDGYNSNRGGERVTEFGEDHPCAKLTNEQVLEIKELLKNSTLTQKELSKKFNIAQAIISRINDGKNWTTVGNYTYPIRGQFDLKPRGSKSPRASLTDEQVMEIRRRYVNESAPQIYKDYSQYCSLVTIERVVTGKAYKNLPIYKKREKRWINN